MSIKTIITLLAFLIAGSACRQIGLTPAATAVATALPPTPESAPLETVPAPNIAFEGDSFTGHVHMSSLRIPLASLTAVDLANITEIALIFDQTPTGTLFLADLELIK